MQRVRSCLNPKLTGQSRRSGAAGPARTPRGAAAMASQAARGARAFDCRADQSAAGARRSSTVRGAHAPNRRREESSSGRVPLSVAIAPEPAGHRTVLDVSPAWGLYPLGRAANA